MKLGYVFADAYLMAKEKSTPFTKEHHQPAEKVVSTPPPHLSLMCPRRGFFIIKSLSKPTLLVSFQRVGFLLCFQQKRRRFFDHRRIHQEQAEI